MKQIRALCDVWIDKIVIDERMILVVYNQNPYLIHGGLIRLDKGDWLQFIHVAGEDNPYEKLVKDYPDWFELVS